MHLSQLILENFRSYQQKRFDFDEKLNLILGANGSGKTNALEAIFLLASGKSFRSSTLSQLINWDKNYVSVRGTIISKDQKNNLEVLLVKEANRERVTRKYLVDGVIKTRSKYLGTLKTVVFEQEDIRFVAGSPTRRRDYLDGVFTATEWRYAVAISQYHRALRHRNKLLYQIKKGLNLKAEIFYWDQSLVKNGIVIQDYRQKLVRSINSFWAGHENPEVRQNFIKYLPSALSLDKLEGNYQLDLERGFTSLGPHRDDFSFNNTSFSTEDKNLAFWGSRGQQRMAVLALRLAQINYLEETYKQKPILLLDDIFSELDPEHQLLVVGICNHYQTFFTSSNSEVAGILPSAEILNL